MIKIIHFYWILKKDKYLNGQELIKSMFITTGLFYSFVKC